MTSQDSQDIMPDGVELRDPEDFNSLRSATFNSVKDAFQSKFPHSYGGVRIEVENLDYENPKDYNFKDQKDALLKNRFLSWRLRGDLKLYDEKTNELLDEKRTTLMRVPYLTERGTTIHNGNEYVTLTQARLLPGVYTRRRTTGEIESHFNPRRSSGRSFRVRLEPESQLYKMDIGQASLRLYSLLHDMGVSDEELAQRWGPEILEANKASYDSKVFDKAYSRFVPHGEDSATKEEKIKSIKEALGFTKFDSKVTRQTLPNLGNRKVASTWMAKAAMMAPMSYPNPQNAVPQDPYSQLGAGNPDLANQPVAQTQEEYLKFEEQKQKEKQKEEEKHMKARMQIDALRGKMPPPGPDRDAVEKELVSGQLAIRKAKQQAQTKRISQSVKIDTQEKARQIKEEGEAEVKQIQDQVDMQNQDRDYHKTREDEHVNHEKQKQTILQQQQLKQEAEQRKMEMQQEIESLKMQGDPTYGMQQEGMQQEMDPMQQQLGKIASILPDMLEAKEYSDKGQYPPKHNIMRKLIEQSPSAFRYTEEEGTTPGMRGIEHVETGFRMHLPKDLFGGLANGGPNGIKPMQQTFSGPRPTTEDNRKAFDAKYGPGAYDKIQPRVGVSSDPKHPGYDPKFKPDWDSVKKDTVMYKESARKNVRVIENGQMIDVDKLYKMTEGREYTDVPLETISGYGTRSKRDRYGPMRYEDADPEKPGLIDERGFIIDGRHRYFKNKDMGNYAQKFYRVSDEELSNAYADGTHGDYESTKKVKL